MKKASLITNVVLAIAVIVLFVLHFTSNSNSLKNDSGSGSAPAAGSVVYIQMDSLVNQYDMFNDLKSELESKAQVMQDDLNKKGMAFERDVKDFRQKVEKGLITSAQAEDQNAQLKNRERELKNYSQQRQMEMNEEQAVLVRKVMDALDKYLVKFNADKKYSMIINTSATLNTVLRADSTLNITNMVVAGLNDEYVATKGKK